MYFYIFIINLQNPSDDSYTRQTTEDDKMTHSTQQNILETFEEKKIKSKALMEQFIMYCVDGDYFPFLLTTTNNPQQMQRFIDFFQCICTKFSTIYKVYKLKDIHQTENIQLSNRQAAAHYWMNTCIIEAEFILSLFDKQNMSHSILHNKLIKLLSKVNEKIHAYFKTTIWQEQQKVGNL